MQRYIIFMLDVRARTPPASVDYVSADEGIGALSTREKKRPILARAQNTINFHNTLIIYINTSSFALLPVYIRAISLYITCIALKSALDQFHSSKYDEIGQLQPSLSYTFSHGTSSLLDGPLSLR
jgi:hypothetical protein